MTIEDGDWRKHFTTFLGKYLYNRNILEYAQIARSGLKSMIIDIKGHSNR